MSNVSTVALYPRYCFHLAPTANVWCLLRVCDIHGLKQHNGFEGENFYFYKNLPIKWVRIVGIVVSVDEFAGRRAYTVDDSSGACIEALITVPVPPIVAGAVNTEDTGATATKPEKHAAVDQSPGLYGDIDVGAIVDIKGCVSTFRDERQIMIEKVTLLKSTAQEVTLWEKRAKFRREVLRKPWVLRDKDVSRCHRAAERSEAEAERKQKRVKAVADRTLGKRQVKPPTRIEPKKKSASSRDVTADDVKEIIRDGAIKGKYSALGL